MTPLSLSGLTQENQVLLLGTAYPRLQRVPLAVLAALWGTSRPPVWALRSHGQIAAWVADAVGGRAQDTDISAALKKLRRDGFGIRSHFGIGWQLVAVPEPNPLALRFQEET
jgi:hypothetical protein